MLADERDARRPLSSPEVIDYRLYRFEEDLDRVSARLGQVDIQIARHGERMEAIKGQIQGVDDKAGVIQQTVQRLEDQRFANLWGLLLATITVIGAVIGSHFLIK
jgi:hypothetical protein